MSNPGAGSPGDIRAGAGRRQTDASTARDAAHNTSLAGTVARAGWQGLAADALNTRSAMFAAELEAIAGQAEADAGTLRRYANDVETIQHQQNALTARRVRLSSTLRTTQHRRSLESIPMDDATQRSIDLKVSALHEQIAGIDIQLAALAQQRSTADSAAIMGLTSASSRGGLASFPAVSTGSISGIRLQDLAGLSEIDLATLFRLHPELTEQIQETAGGPGAVASWWAALSTDQKENLVLGASALIGNLEGITYRARSFANNIILDRRIAAAEKAGEHERTNPPWADPGSLNAPGASLAGIGTLKNIKDSLVSPPGGAPRFLVSLTADHPPLAAVSIGDMDTADNVTYAIPGMGTSATGMTDWARSSQNIAAAQGLVDPDHSHAVVAWIGYKTPPVPGPTGGFDVFGSGFAQTGAVKLDSALAGFAAVRPDAQLNIVAHSYGTTTAATALTAPGTHVDTLVTLGSAGLPAGVDKASDIHAGQVFAGQAQDVMAIDPAHGDQWAWTGRLSWEHPVDPISPGFGAHDFSVAGGGGLNPVTDHGVSTPGGTGYLDQKTESLLNVAYATTGQESKMTAYVPPGPTPFQQALIDAGSSGAY